MMDQQELDFLTQQKIELMITMRTKKLGEEIAQLKDLVTNAQSELFALRQHVETLKSRGVVREEPVITSATPERVRPEHGAPPAQPSPQAVPSSAQIAQQQAQAKPEHPRQGKFTSDDVSIEKYFNFSRK